MPLTVLQICSGDLWAGAEVMAYRLACRLAEIPDVRVVALILNEGTLAGKLREQGIETRVIPERGENLPTIVWEAYRAFHGRPPDLIHTHRYKEDLVGFLLAKLMGVKCLVATVHGLPELPRSGRAGGRPVPWKVRFDHFLLRFAFRTVVAVSEEMQEALVGGWGLPPERITVIHNGIELPPDTGTGPWSAGRPFRIGTVGRFVPVKDFDLFLETAALVARRSPAVRFSLLGGGPLLEALRGKAAQLGISHLVDFMAPVSDPLPYYRSLDLYLCTSHHEGIPLSVLEAMACGKPVVASRVGGIPEIVTGEAEGQLVPTRRPDDYADACLALIADPDRRGTMGRAARERVRSRFSDVMMAGSYVELYRRLQMEGPR